MKASAVKARKVAAKAATKAAKPQRKEPIMSKGKTSATVNDALKGLGESIREVGDALADDGLVSKAELPDVFVAVADTILQCAPLVPSPYIRLGLRIASGTLRGYAEDLRDQVGSDNG